MLLAGPILRRTDKNRVCIWFATSNDATISIAIYQNSNSAVSIAQCPENAGKANKIKLGQHLYVHLLEIIPDNNAQFPVDEILLYNAWIDNEELSALNLDLSYKGLSLPSFFIPSDLQNFLFASCRKPHAFEFKHNGSPDRLKIGDDLINKSPEDLTMRPAALFLIGDQIYADDVAMPVLERILRRAEELMGHNEQLVSSQPGSNKTITPATEFLIRGRQEICDTCNDIGFSSSHAHNHLFTFGEYAAMYLDIFAEVVNDDYANWDDIKNKVEYNEESDGFEDDTLLMIGMKYKCELKEVRTFNKSLPAVRRLMANIPTYMIFDDHEVTDDWNISKKWVERVNKSHFGEQIISNALAAYWAFQGWGNDPDLYDANFKSALSTYLSADTYDSADAAIFKTHLFNATWQYSAPFDKPVIILDTRTQRFFDNKKKPARLLNSKSLHWLAKEWKSLSEKFGTDTTPCPAIIISPTPVFGFVPIEAGQTFLKSIGICNATADVEAWSTNKEGMKDLLKTVTKEMKPGWCMFISGDVHYSFVRHIEKYSIPIYQLTSSPLKNVSNKSWLFHALLNAEESITKKSGYVKPTLKVFGTVTNQNNIGWVLLRNNKPFQFSLCANKENIQIYSLKDL